MGNGESQPADKHDEEEREEEEREEEDEQEQEQEQRAENGSESDATVQRMSAAISKQEAAATDPTPAQHQDQLSQPQKQPAPSTATQQPQSAQPVPLAAPTKPALSPQPLAPLSKPLSPLRQPLPQPQLQPEVVALTPLKQAASAAPVAVAPAKAAAVVPPVASVATSSASTADRPPPGATTEAEDDNPLEAPEGSPEPPARLVSDRSGVGEEHLDLWYALVEWVSEAQVLDTGVVLAWDSEEVGARVLSLTTDKRLMDTLSIKQAERKRARMAALRAEQAKKRGEDNAAAPHELQPLSHTAAASSSSSSTSGYKHALPALPPGVSIPYALAEDLLVLDRSLAQLRHTWVPSRVSEDTFWSAYFAAVLRTIREHVLSLQQPDEQLQDTNPALEQMQMKEGRKQGAQKVLDDIIRKQIDKECHSAQQR